MAQGFSNSRLLQVGGACLIASSAGVPIAMSPVSIRANDFAKLLTLVPLSMIGLSAIVWAVGWRGILGEEKHERRATMALLAFILLAAITTATADSQAIAFFGRLFRPEGMAAWIAIAAAFLGLRAWTRATGRGMEFADVMLLTSLVPAGYARLAVPDCSAATSRSCSSLRWRESCRPAENRSREHSGQCWHSCCFGRYG
jgi:hypothetical protein